MMAFMMALALLLYTAPWAAAAPAVRNQSDTTGCLVKQDDEHSVWIVHTDNTRNWIPSMPAECFEEATVWPDQAVNLAPARYNHGGTYEISGSRVAVACANTGCCGLIGGAAGHWNLSSVHPCPPPPPRPAVTSVSPMRLPLEGGGPELVVRGTSFNGSNGSALCRITAAPGATALGFNATAFAGRVLNDPAIVCSPPPAVIADGPGVLQVSLLGVPGAEAGGDFHGAHVAGKGDGVVIRPLVEITIGRRPYITELAGEVLLSTAPELAGQVLEVRAALPAAGPAAVWRWPAVAGGKEVALPLDFGVLMQAVNASAPIHNDILFEIVVPGSSGASGSRVLHKRRRFHRVPPPPLLSHVVPVQVDHGTAGLLVGGEAWVGTGWYLERDIPTEDLITMISTEFGPRGINQGMLYGLHTRPRDEIDRIMDAAAAVGFKFMWPLVDKIGPVDLQTGGPFNNSTRLAQLVANVTYVREHPALLGYCKSSPTKCTCSC
eukprot:SAG22_NODE_151_length_17414_cov_7.812128_12_plen_492_part_00